MLMLLSAQYLNQTFALVDALTFSDGPHQRPMINIETDLCKAEISCQGGHLIAFTPRNERPIIWTSKDAIFAEGKAIRGGIPICWPWFGPHPDDTSKGGHGIARTAMWHVSNTLIDAQGNVKVTLKLNSCAQTKKIFPYHFDLELQFIFGTTLSVTLSATNTDVNPFVVTGALHTYFGISDIDDICISGLEDVHYIDKLDNLKIKSSPKPIIFTEEVDRVYEKTDSTTMINDPKWERKIIVKKSGSLATVIWNPWIEKCKTFVDMHDTEYREMVCIEVANAGSDIITIPPGGTHQLSTTISAHPLR